MILVSGWGSICVLNRGWDVECAVVCFQGKGMMIESWMKMGSDAGLCPKERHIVNLYRHCKTHELLRNIRFDLRPAEKIRKRRLVDI